MGDSSSSKRIKVSALSSKLFVKKVEESTVELDSEDTIITREIEIYDAIRKTTNLQDYLDETTSRMDVNQFWADQKKTLPIHYNMYVGDCASKRASSAAVETVYSGATKLSDEAQMLGDDTLAAYVFDHYNWKYTFLRPTVNEIVEAYLKLHGSEAPAEEEVVVEAGEEPEGPGEEEGEQEGQD